MRRLRDAFNTSGLRRSLIVIELMIAFLFPNYARLCLLVIMDGILGGTPARVKKKKQKNERELGANLSFDSPP